MTNSALVLSAGVLVLSSAAAAATGPPTDGERRELERTSDLALERRIDGLLAAMNLEEKIGQMTMVNIAEPGGGDPAATGWDPTRPPAVSAERIETVLGRHQVGALMTDAPMTPTAWVEFIGRLQREALARSPQKIPMMYAICHMHGAGFLIGGTVFPHNLNLAATFDPEFARAAGAITALETADLGHHWLYTPVVDIGRNPRWGRYYETAGESPVLGAALAAAIVEGVQDNPETAPYRVVASAKHFIGYSDPASGYDRSPAAIPDQALYEYWVPAFQAAIDAGVGIIETNSGEVNGVPVHASRRLLTTLLRDEMGFKGVLNTDWGDVAKLVTLHRVAENEKEAALLAIEAGNDLVLTGFDTAVCDHLAELVREGRLGMDRIDLSVARVLRLKLQLGLFDNPLPRRDRFDRVGRPESRARALEAARESLVLLRNEEGILPLDPEGLRALIVTGPLARNRPALAGGWTLSWTLPTDEMMPADMPSVLRALRDRYGSGRVWHRTTSDGVRWLAPEADAIVYVAGEEPYAEFKGSVDDLSLPDDQIAGIEAAIATGRPVILVMVGGRPRIITKVFDRCAAVVWAGLPGFEGGRALADVVSGAVNPSGKLPFAYPASPSRLVTYDHKASLDSETEPRSPWTVADFGSGLSYTTFEYGGLALSRESLSDATDTLTATVTVTNSGERPGRESVLWFLTDEVGSITRPVRQLAHFEKIALEPGESRTLSFVIEPQRDLSYPDDTGAPLLEAGFFTLTVGDESARFPYAP